MVKQDDNLTRVLKEDGVKTLEIKKFENLSTNSIEKIKKTLGPPPWAARLVYNEIFGGVSGFVITSSDSVLAPNAGIDRSNSDGTKLILYPENPYQVAENLKRKIFFEYNIYVGVIIVDSRLMPARVGTVGIAIACAGFEPVNDLRGKQDLDGNPLKVTFQATADNLASIANHKMGEGSESQPIAIIKDSECSLTSRNISYKEMAISHEQCVYVRGFSDPYN